MADWIWVESAGTTQQMEPRVKRAQFGDGYEQVMPDGINFMPQTWEGVFDGVDDAIADEMVAFLETHKGCLPFNYVPMRQTVAIKVLGRRWSRSITGIGESSVRVNFEQWFGP